MSKRKRTSRFSRTTPRQRALAAGGALLLAAVIAWGLHALLALGEPDYRNTVFTREFTTDNMAHPIHRTLPGGKEETFDILKVENLSDQPLSLLPFSSRPRIPNERPDQVMVNWARWIATTRQGIMVQPHTTWTRGPADRGTLLSIRGHTWIAVFFSGAQASEAAAVPVTVLPGTFRGRFRMGYKRAGGINPRPAALPARG